MRNKFMSYKIQKGKKGELAVADCLKKNGYSILHRNYRYKTGEIDIIAQKEDTISFVEVKLRNNPLIDPAEIITPSKQKKIISVAKLFVSHHTSTYHKDCIYRFDVALVEEKNNTLNIRYIPDAFSAFE